MKLNWLTQRLYRKKATGIVINSRGELLMNQLIDYGGNDWNFPGGGVEKGETEKEALLRELKEELGTDKFKILKKGRIVSTYNWPLKVIIKRCINNKGVWRGQSARHFLVKFTGSRNDIKPNPKEIRKIKWIKRSELKNYLNFPNQLRTIEDELENFGL